MMFPVSRPAAAIVLFFALVCSALAETARPFTVQFSPASIEWNPHYGYTTTEGQIFTALYEGLTVYNPANLLPEPGAAEQWDLSEDQLTLTFTLRNNARWSNGDVLTSHDFRKSWLVLLSPETDSGFASLLDDISGAREYRTGQGPAEDVDIRTPDNKTLVVGLKHPSPQFLSILSHYSFAPVYKDFLSQKDWSSIRRVPVNGPYVIRARTEDEVLLSPNSYYHSPEKAIGQGIKLLFLEDPEEVMQLFNQYEIDWIVSGMDPDNLDIPEAMNISPLFSTTYYYFSNKRPPWNDTRVRRALSMLVPWEQIRAEKFIPATTLVPQIPGYPRASQEFPPAEERKDRAFKLLGEAGYPGGAGLPNPVIRVPAEDETSEQMKETWDSLLNLQTEIEVVDFSRYFESLKDDRYDLATLTWTGDYADPYTFLGMWESTSSFNDAQYSDYEFDTLLMESARLSNMKRFQKLGEAENVLLQSGQVMPVEHIPAINIIDRRFVDGWFSNALDIHPFGDIAPRFGYSIPGVVRR